MIQVFTALFEKAKGNPVGIALVCAGYVLYKGAEALPETFEPFRTLIMGFGALVGIGGGAWVGKRKPPEEPPK